MRLRLPVRHGFVKDLEFPRVIDWTQQETVSIERVIGALEFKAGAIMEIRLGVLCG